MNRLIRFLTLFAAIAIPAGSCIAQQQPAQRTPHIGYVYPAGGRQGTTFQLVVGGQFLNGVSDARFSGDGVKATIVEYFKPLTPQQATQLRDRMRELLERRSGTTAASTRPSTQPKWTTEDDRAITEIRAKLMTFVRKPSSPALAETITLNVTIESNSAPGRRELRLRTPTGFTNPLVFCVDQLPEFSEPPARNLAQPVAAVARNERTISIPAIVNGQILAGGVNRYHFSAHQGQRLVVAAKARALIPYLADAVPGWFQATLSLYDSNGNEVAYDDDFRFDPDPVIYYAVPKDGQYTIEIKDAIYRGREDFVYRIAIGELPYITGIFPLGGKAGASIDVALTGWNLPQTHLARNSKSDENGITSVSVTRGGLVSNSALLMLGSLPECFEKESNDQPRAAQPVVLPVIVNGRIDHSDDADVYSFQGHGGDEVVAEVYARRLGSPLDSVLALTDTAGKQLAFNDDHDDKASGLITHQADSWIRAKLPADGTYYLRLTDAQHKGGAEYAYRLRIGEPRPDFELRVVPSSTNARAGTSVPVTVFAMRRDGFSDKIALALEDAPDGFALSSAVVAAQQDQATLTLIVPRSASNQIVALRLQGHALIEGREVVHRAVPADDMMQAFLYRHLVPADEMLVTVWGRATAGPFARNMRKQGVENAK